MENQRNNIDNLFREGLGSYTETPPPAAWDALEKRLDGRRERKPFPFLFFLSALLSSAVVLGIWNARRTTENPVASEHTPGNTAHAAPAAAPVASSNAPVATLTVEIENMDAPDNRGSDPLAATENGKSGRQVIPAAKHSSKDRNTESPVASSANVHNSVANNTSHSSGHNKVSHSTTIAANTNKAASKNVVATNQRANDESLTQPAGTTPLVLAAHGAKHNLEPAIAKNNTVAPDAKSQQTGIDKKAVNETEPANTVASGKKAATQKQVNTPATEKATMPVVAAVLQRDDEHKATTEQKNTVTTNNVATAAEKPVNVNTRRIEPKNAFTETVTVIKLDAPVAAKADTASGSGAASGGMANAAKTKRWEAGLKGGYETGTRALTADKFLFAPYLKYNITPKTSIIIQPGIKFASIRNTLIDPAKNYYNIQNSLVDTQRTVVGSNTTYTFQYFENGDSIRVSHSIAKRNYVELEIPVLFSHQVTKSLSILAGISMMYSKLAAVSKDSSGYGSFNLHSSVSYTLPNGSEPNPPSLNSVIGHPGLPYVTLANPAYQLQTGDLFRLGYMFGFSYDITKRIFFDGMLQQSFMNFTNIKNGDVKNLYNQPNVRITLGFKLTQPR